ncbi:MAG: hypothetical protein KDF60_11220 [Calditrichaeota bacterium]|nr:hypothetical protein [Calditrichota bacterium]
MQSSFKIICFPILIVFLIHYVQAQDIRIEEIMDANLFLTEDSMLISMANLNVPSIYDADSVRKDLAKKIMEYACLHLRHYSCRFIPSAQKCNVNTGQSGHLFRKYPLSDLNMNAQYLEKGYAVYLPCDTLFMQEYSSSSQNAIENRLGIWKPLRSAIPPNYFNRFRLTNWLLMFQFDLENYFPIFGMNYRWSDIFSFYRTENKSFSVNMSGEAGTLLYFMLPYANLGPEIRFKNFYIRGSYNALLPIIWVFEAEELHVYDFWALDVGFRIPIGSSVGLELEYNAKKIDKNTFRIFSISFATY